MSGVSSTNQNRAESYIRGVITDKAGIYFRADHVSIPFETFDLAREHVKEMATLGWPVDLMKIEHNPDKTPTSYLKLYRG